MTAFDNKTNHVLGGSISRALLRLAAPMLASALLQNVQSLIDLFWVGRLGPQALASVAVSATILMLLFPMLMGVSTGTMAVVSRAIGGGRPTEAARAAGQSLTLALALGIVSGVVGWLFAESFLRLLGPEADVIAAGADYLRVNLLGSFSVFLLFLANAALQGAGDTLRPMYAMGLANLLNIVLDPLLIFGLGPVPALGVRGAAIATVLSQAAGAALAVRSLATGSAALTVPLSAWKPDRARCGRILRIGIPGSGQMLSRSLVNAFMMRIVAGCGTAAVAAYGTGMRFHMILLMPAFAFGGAAATMVGQNLGAEQPTRARRAAWAAVAMDGAIMVASGVLLFAAAPHLIALFNSDPEVVAIGSRFLRILSPFYIFAAVGIVLTRALSGAGDTLVPMILTIVTLWGLQAPLALAGAKWWRPATDGIWWAMAASIIMNGTLIAAWFLLDRWSKRRI